MIEFQTAKKSQSLVLDSSFATTVIEDKDVDGEPGEMPTEIAEEDSIGAMNTDPVDFQAQSVLLTDTDLVNDLEEAFKQQKSTQEDQIRMD